MSVLRAVTAETALDVHTAAQNLRAFLACHWTRSITGYHDYIGLAGPETFDVPFAISSLILQCGAEAEQGAHVVSSGTLFTYFSASLEDDTCTAVTTLVQQGPLGGFPRKSIQYIGANAASADALYEGIRHRNSYQLNSNWKSSRGSVFNCAGNATVNGFMHVATPLIKQLLAATKTATN